MRFAQDDDFDPGSRVRPAHRTIDGLVLLEGGGLRAPLPTAPGRDAYLARVAALSTPGPGAPNVFLPALFGLINVVDLGAGAELSGAAGRFDPDGPSLVQRTTLAGTLDLLIQTPATNRAIVGFFLDDDFSANPAFRASLGLSDDGPNVYNLDLDAYVPRDPGRTRTWKDIDDDPSLPVCGPADDPALSPGCAILDNGPRGSSALGDESLLAVTQNANVDVPVLCIGGSNGLAPAGAIDLLVPIGAAPTETREIRRRFPPGAARLSWRAVNERVPVLASRGGSRGLLVPLAWLVVATVLTVGLHVRWLDTPFTWASAHSAVMARSFLDLGVLELRGIPVENNPPLGLEPERYLHWPPLYPILLSELFRRFGESAAVARGFQLLLVLAHAVVLGVLAWTISRDVRTGLLAAFAWLVIPTVAEYGYIAWQLHLALLCTSLSLWAFVNAGTGARVSRGWALLGTASLVSAVLASWEPLMMLPGLVAAAWWAGVASRRRLALIYAAVAGLTVLGVLGLFVTQVPSLAGDLLATLEYRVGVSAPGGELSVKNLLIYSRYPQLALAAPRDRTPTQLGPPALLSIAWLLWRAWHARRSGRAGVQAPVFAGWLSLPFLWGLVFSNQMLHYFEQAIFAPLATLALALAIVALADASAGDARRGRRLAGLTLEWGVLPALAAAFGLGAALDRPEHGEPPAVLAYARAIESSTGSDAVVLTPRESMVPVYYSRRHLMRAVGNDAAFETSLPRVRRSFPCAPLYLALQPQRTAGFERALRRHRPVHRSQALLLLELEPGGGDADASRGCLTPRREG